jgi:hypothetical protein
VDTVHIFPAIERLNVTPESTTQSDAYLSIEAVQEMTKYGITCSQTSLFSYGAYRYTNLGDAIAEAKRHPHAG